MDRTGAAIFLDGLRMKYEALGRMDGEFSEIYRNLVEALAVALEALHTGG